jgi:hypothetical protein
MATEIDASGIQSVWDAIPSVECDGRCQDHCVAVPMSMLELALVRGKMPWYPDHAQIAGRMKEGILRCPALTAHGRCGVYEVRPTVCRLFGAVDNETIRCPYGCEPVLTEDEGSEILNAALDIGGPIA